MPRSPLRTECPHCKCKMQINPLNGEVLSHEAPPEDFAAAERKATRDAEQQRKDAFDAALNAEKSRAKDLDDLFRKAAESQEKKGEDDPPSHALDDKWQ